MVEPRKRATASLKVKYKSASLAQFTHQFGLDVSRNGIFIKTKAPLEPAVLIRLELQLSDGSPVVQGSGRVAWRRLPGPEGAPPAGMGIEFIRLLPQSRELVESIVDARSGRPSRFDWSDGAEQLSGSAPLVTALPSTLPSPIDALPPLVRSPVPPPELPDAAAALAPAGPATDEPEHDAHHDHAHHDHAHHAHHEPEHDDGPVEWGSADGDDLPAPWGPSGPTLQPLAHGFSSLVPPPRSATTTLVWVLVLACTLTIAALTFVLLKRPR